MARSNKEYLISIITPFHNIDMKMFEITFSSMTRQTIGFENIQWVIVLHNCQQEYIEGVSRLAGSYENVQLKILNNDRHTASSPRNYGLNFAVAPYVGFLDGDDSYTPDCLKAARQEMMQAGAQIAAFRMEYELTAENAVTFPDTVLWNQCEERIVMERGQWDKEKMFSGMFGWVTSRLYDRKMLMDNRIFFDEDVILAEDFHMFIRAVAAAERIVYLPQLIGYHYCVNGGSTLQSRKSGDVLVDYAKGLKILFETFDEYHIPKYFTQRCACVLSDMIMASDSITPEHRQAIKDYIGRFVEDFTEYPANKLTSPELAELYCKLPKRVILDTADPLQDIYIKRFTDGETLLAAILRKNMDTDYGRKYCFREIKTIEKYADTVPFISHERFQKLIRLQMGIGEKQILTNDPPQYYFINAAGEYIPSVREHFETYLKAFSSTLEGKRNLLLSTRKNTIIHSNDGALVGDLESILLVEYFTKKYYTWKERKAEFTAPVGVYFNEYASEEECYYVLMKYALLDRELEQIVALSTENVLRAFEVLERNAERLLLETAAVNAERAEELRKVFSDGFDVPIAAKIWPGLQRVTAFGVGENYESFAKLKRFTGDVRHNHGYYYTEEAVLGQACGDDSELFEKATLGEEFFELVSIRDGHVSLLSQARIGEPYQLVVTNNSGLYRFETSHFIRIRSKDYDKITYTIY